MKILSFAFQAFLIGLFLASCSSPSTVKNENEPPLDTVSYLKSGDSISSAVQKVLLANVMEATKKGGTGFAITYCNEKAMPLTDSLSAVYNCTIQRVTDKYRNPANKLSANDSVIFSQILASGAFNSGIVAENGTIVYFKPIKIAMPACLNCHGTAGKELKAEIVETIKKKYPEDKATGYKEGDLRGMWKITFKLSK